jgi:CBS domain-containing protein
MHVEQILARKGREVVVVAPGTTIAEAAAVLAQWRIGAVLVRDRAGDIKGLLSERDIVRGLAQAGAAILERPVESLMTVQVVYCAPTDTIDHLMALMTERRMRHLPVMADGALVGMISIGDVVKHRISEIEQEAEAMRAYIVAA